MRTLILWMAVLPLLTMAAGCGEDTKHQSTFRGLWKLHSRTLPGGEVRIPPTISGVLEWFPIDEKQSYIIQAFSAGEDNIKITEFFITMDKQTATRQVRLQVGDDVPLPVAAASAPALTGQISADGARTTLSFPDNTSYAFAGATLTITHRDGSADTWKRTDDQKGLLAK